jgi:hypothetical protein
MIVCAFWTNTTTKSKGVDAGQHNPSIIRPGQNRNPGNGLFKLDCPTCEICVPILSETMICESWTSLSALFRSVDNNAGTDGKIKIASLL